MENSRSSNKTWYSVLAILLLKFGGKLGTLLLKFLKLFKLTTVASAGVFLGVYSYIWTWQFAATIFIALAVHESGHLWAMKRVGLPIRGMYFIPFVGALIVPEKDFPTKRSEGMIAIMGPLVGSVLALAILTAAVHINAGPLWIGVASFIALINLFNMIPVLPLDGGRVIRSIAGSIRSSWGLPLLLIMTAIAFYLLAHFSFGLLIYLFLIGTIEMVAELLKYYRQGDSARFRRALSELFCMDNTDLWMDKSDPNFMKRVTSIRFPETKEPGRPFPYQNHQGHFVFLRSDVQAKFEELLAEQDHDGAAPYSDDRVWSDDWYVLHQTSVVQVLVDLAFPDDGFFAKMRRRFAKTRYGKTKYLDICALADKETDNVGAMKPHETALLGSVYVGLSVLLLTIILLAHEVPGADIALKILQAKD